MSQKFEGDLSHIEPYRLIREDADDLLANFFLTLAVIYNDLKVMLYKYHLGDLGFYKAHNLNDNMVKQALQSIQ